MVSFPVNIADGEVKLQLRNAAEHRSLPQCQSITCLHQGFKMAGLTRRREDMLMLG